MRLALQVTSERGSAGLRLSSSARGRGLGAGMGGCPTRLLSSWKSAQVVAMERNVKVLLNVDRVCDSLFPKIAFILNCLRYIAIFGA